MNRFSLSVLTPLPHPSQSSNPGQTSEVSQNSAMEELDFNVEEATIKSIQQAFAEGKLTARNLVDFYLHQIEHLNPLLRAVIEVNPDAQLLADESDKARSRNADLGELHGIPVLLKDTIGTRDRLSTTAGSYALLGSKVRRDAAVVERLRRSGAVILGKASLSEWYRFRSLSGVPDGWCARSGQGVNPYVSSGTPCGSSSGSAISVAANMVCVSLGTETHSSIICPSDHNSVVGIKPTVGLTSRAGVIPMTPRWDTIGPICRTVSDAVHVLDVIAGFDPSDEATREAAKYIPEGGYKQFLNEDGLKGKRLGVVRHPFMEIMQGTAESAAFELHLDTMRHRGARVMDNLKIDEIETILDPNQSGEIIIMAADFKAHINVYLNEEVDDSPVHSLADIIAFNEDNAELEMLKEHDQNTFIEAEKTNGLGEREEAILENLAKLSINGFEKVMKEHKLDAMVTPGSRASPVYAIGGYPAITVPAGYETDGMPFGICFGGLRGSEPKLIQISYAFEQVTKVRKPPSLAL
ncbi:probable amidase At4g34880 [Salvia miltiorrhiza]|uniref:probable amidase At4g34880 n=1 Tax=Salvia miltiorrhiza TaxID=226208 RepID=UPI0025AD5C33|nr:probable amidase At4g34880 [Salvia miltiorrhiza]